MPTVHNFSDTLLALAAEVELFIPKLVGAIIWLLIGWIVASVLKAALSRGLRTIHFDDIADRAGIGRALQAASIQLDAAGAMAGLVYWYVFLYFAVLAISTLGIGEITPFLNSVLNYLPNVVVAILILVGGAFLANLAGRATRGAAAEAGIATERILGAVVQYAILLFAAFSALTQLQIAQSMLLILFGGLIAALSLAGGLAFGLGGVDSARSLLASQTMSNMLQPGQQIQIGQQTGTVVRHDLNATVLDTGNGQVSIPNSALTSHGVTVLNGQKGTQQQNQPQPAS